MYNSIIDSASKLDFGSRLQKQNVGTEYDQES